MARCLFISPLLLLLLLLVFVHEVSMSMETTGYLFKRHIGSARENRYRAQQRMASNVGGSNSGYLTTHPVHLQHLAFLSPEFLRARWMEVYHEQNPN